MSKSVIAATRFGYGMRAGETLPSDPEAWLRNEASRFDPRPAPFAALPDSATTIKALRYRPEGMGDMSMDQSPQAKRDRRRDQTQDIRQQFQRAVAARFKVAVESETPFAERLVHFWSNHFAVSAKNLPNYGLSPHLEIEAVRPHIYGTFKDLLLAVEQHPAMLVYLDQVLSIGPESAFLTRRKPPRRKLGLNENLAREILELHTLGVNGGYGQQDVQEFAKALTGWTVPGLARGGIKRRLDKEKSIGGAGFVAALHEPGTRTVMGRSYNQKGSDQAVAILSDLAVHPSTARHIATKLARHFYGDTPPASLTDRLAETFTQTGGQLAALYDTLIASPEVWSPEARKFKSPWDWSVSAYRALGIGGYPVRAVSGMLEQLGQPVWRPGAPAGFEDSDARWLDPGSLLRRIELAGRLATQADRKLNPAELPGSLFIEQSDETKQAIARAESDTQGFAILLGSPGFMWR